MTPVALAFGTTTIMSGVFLPLHLYRRLARLRPFLTAGKHAYNQNYHALLRYRFAHPQEYNLRRELVLGLPPLTERELHQRAQTTLTFLHNAACTGSSQESKIFATLMEMEYVKNYSRRGLSKIHIGRSYRWMELVDAYTCTAKLAERGELSGPQLRAFERERALGAPLLSLWSYEGGLMRFNESVGLLL